MPSPDEAGFEPLDSPLRAWIIVCAGVDRAPAQAGLTQTFRASDAERSEIAEALGLTQCFSVSATVTIHARAGGRYLLDGRLLADVQQACVVTLEPVPQHIDVPVAAEFCPPADIAAAGPVEAHFDPDSDDDPIAIVDGQLDAGQLVFELLALAVDPFPRAADAETVALEAGPAGRTAPGTAPGRPNPFAVLAKLKPGKDE